MFASEECVRWILQVFDEDLLRLGCKVDVANAVYQPFVEPRESVQEIRGAISERDVNVLFTRFDLQAADSAYGRYVHLDRIRRVVGGLLFCSDQQQEGLVGGEFGLYRDRWPGDNRRCLWPALVKRFGVRHNTGVVFVNANTAFHGPLPIHAIRGLRKWVYYAISSHQPVWPVGRSSTLRNWALQLKGWVGV
jgi:hypothetical protein